MAENRFIGDYPVIGIRPCIDGRRGPLKVRESLEEQTMNMAKAAAKLTTTAQSRSSTQSRAAKAKKQPGASGARTHRRSPTSEPLPIKYRQATRTMRR